MNLVDRMRQINRAVTQRLSFERLIESYDAYCEAPADRVRIFGVLRALVRWCRLHRMTVEHAALLAELARVDDEAAFRWQVVIKKRAATRSHREIQRRDRLRDSAFRTQERQWRRFLAVMERLDAQDTLNQACAAVAAAELMVEPDTVRQDYLAIAGQYRRAGRNTVEIGNPETLRRIPLPRPGRRRKKG